jgi:hypothetical protein
MISEEILAKYLAKQFAVLKNTYNDYLKIESGL